MKNRRVWVLIAVVALLLLVGGSFLTLPYLGVHPVQGLQVRLLSSRDWGFNAGEATYIEGARIRRYEAVYRCGFFMVRLERPPPPRVIATVKRMAGQTAMPR